MSEMTIQEKLDQGFAPVTDDHLNYLEAEAIKNPYKRIPGWKLHQSSEMKDYKRALWMRKLSDHFGDRIQPHSPGKAILDNRLLVTWAYPKRFRLIGKEDQAWNRWTRIQQLDAALNR